MKIFREGSASPDFLSSIKTDTNIIMCLHPSDKDVIHELKTFPDRFELTLPRDINLSINDVISISSSILATTIRPNIKISFPVGIIPQFTDFIGDHNQDIFLKIYKSFDVYNSYKEGNILDHHILENIRFILYIDVIRMREAGLQMILKKGTPIIELFFSYYIQTKTEMNPIEEIYLIIDDQVYTDFVNIF